MKSRPVYGRLSPQPGRAHILVADAEGAQAILDLAVHVPLGFFNRAHILYTLATGAAASSTAKLKALQPLGFGEYPSIPAMLPALAQILSTAHMGDALYLSGSEGLIGQAMKLALDAGIDHAAIVTEHRGSLKRRVQCVHCKGVTEDVVTQPTKCGHCGLTLFVRDHYSRRIAAFQGVCIDAEEPGVIPEFEDIFR